MKVELTEIELLEKSQSEMTLEMKKKKSQIKTLLECLANRMGCVGDRKLRLKGKAGNLDH